MYANRSLIAVRLNVVRMILLIMVVLSATTMISPANIIQAQTAEKLTFVIKGDLYEWYPGLNAPNRLTTWKYNSHPVASPDGRYVAYLSVSQAAVTAFRLSSPQVAQAPTNIWLYDTTIQGDAAFTRLVDQPANAVFAVQNRIFTFSNIIIRSRPAWSPDGRQLVWAEALFDGNQYIPRLAGYNFDTGKSAIFNVAFPSQFQDGEYYYVPEVKWGYGGISMLNTTYDQTAAGFVTTLTIFQTQADFTTITQVNRFAVTGANEAGLQNYVWLQSGKIALVYADGLIRSADPVAVNGALTLAGNVLHMSSAAGTGYSLRIAFSRVNDRLNTSTTINTSAGTIPLTPFDIYNRDYARIIPSEPLLTLSPSGTSIAYVTDAVYILVNGVFTPVPGTVITDDDLIAMLAWPAPTWTIPG